MRYHPHTRVLDDLMCSGIFRVNRALRSGNDALLDRDCHASLDYSGWRSQRHFADAVARLFSDYEALGLLGSHAGQRALRSMWVTPAQLTQIRDERLIWDDGYAFCCEGEEEASAHLREGERMMKQVPPEANVPLLVEFTLGRYALTIPPPGETFPLQPRDDGEMLYLKDHQEVQHILDRRSLIRMSSIERYSHPEFPEGTWRAVGTHVY